MYATQQLQDSYSIRALVGGIAGILMDSSLYPLDTMRTRMKANALESITLTSQMKTMYKHEGLSSFFRGYSCIFTGSFFGNAGYFYVYEKLKDAFIYRNITSKEVSPFFAGFISSFGANIFALPFMVVKSRMQLAPGQFEYRHFFDGVRQIIKTEGFGNLYLGGPVFLTQAALETGLLFGFYELFSKAMEPLFPTKNDVNVPLSVVSSVSAAVVTGFIINPFEVLVTRLQTENTRLYGSSGVLGMAKKIYKNEGLKGYMKGITGTIPMYGLSALVLLPTYEILKGIFGVNLSDDM